MYRGIATFTLDFGRCPRWLFEKMTKLGREIVRVIVEEYGPDEFIKRLADPVWFQSLGTILAFDWNASGLTTVLTAALKEAINAQSQDLGIFVCGGKGKTSRKTPTEIVDWGNRLCLPETSVNNLVYNSKMSAKIDSALVQDNYQLYHHAFFFSRNGAWTVVQQGMNTKNKTARRYHWHSENITDLVNEPHTGIASQLLHQPTLNLTAGQSQPTREISLKLIQAGFKSLTKDIQILRKHATSTSKVLSFRYKNENFSLLKLERADFFHHPVEWENFWQSKYLDKMFGLLCDQKPTTYEALLAISGVGPKTIRALSLISEIIYGTKPSYEDPARYAFAHGGKDGIPYPVDRKTYDQTIRFLRKVVNKTRLSPSEKDKALYKLAV